MSGTIKTNVVEIFAIELPSGLNLSICFFDCILSCHAQRKSCFHYKQSPELKKAALHQIQEFHSCPSFCCNLKVERSKIFCLQGNLLFQNGCQTEYRIQSHYQLNSRKTGRAIIRNIGCVHSYLSIASDASLRIDAAYNLLLWYIRHKTSLKISVTCISNSLSVIIISVPFTYFHQTLYRRNYIKQLY